LAGYRKTSFRRSTIDERAAQTILNGFRSASASNAQTIHRHPAGQRNRTDLEWSLGENP
jgi:hypothetical protein